jgi:2'-5' RNA ligase|tara:strand:+ start:4674 stop:5315 length:642 start_codon:yes stop_codon:yes gene_type:complete
LSICAGENKLSNVRKLGQSKFFKRLFFGIDIPDQTLSNTEKLLNSFSISSSHVKWVRTAHLHITLKFLGDVEEKNISAICSAANNIAKNFEPINLSVVGMGVFPNRYRPKVIWLGVNGDIEDLACLEAKLMQSLTPLGYPPDERLFTAHISIGRIKDNSARGEIIRLVHKYSKEELGDASFSDFHLYESRLGPRESIYTKINSFKLGGNQSTL